MPEFSNNWFAVQGRPFWEGLFAQLKWTDGRPLKVIEIGCYEGQSTVWILEKLLNHADSEIHCIDPFIGVPESEVTGEATRRRFESNVAECANASKVRLHATMSRNALIELGMSGYRADFIYVDGDHRAPGVLEDMVLAFPLLAVGGLMICDDYVWIAEHMGGLGRGKENPINSPKMAIDAFVNIHLQKISLVKGPVTQFAFMKRAD
ncbi:MAG: class I SAM-dependent methyltransferase [Sphingosinicella sp.]